MIHKTPISFILALILVVSATFGAVSHAQAFTIPAFSAVATANNTVQITVNGDPNASIQLYYYNGGFQSVGNIGVTNGNGYFAATIAAGQYGIPAGVYVYVSVNGSQSSTIQWPYFYGNGGGPIYTNPPSQYPQYPQYPSYPYVTPISLSATNISLTSGQYRTVSIYGQGSYNSGFYAGNYYIAGNTNPNVVSVTLSGTSLYLRGNASGYTQITVCQSNGSCARLYVNVTPLVYYYPQPIRYPIYQPYPIYTPYPTYPPYYGYNY